jgi:hypothetical protein
LTTAPDRGDPPSSEPAPRAAVRSVAGWSDAPARPRAPAAPDVAAEPRYVDVELAGVGGMGTVMIAHDRHLGRDVALKRIAADPDDHAAGARLAREAAITARLEHPSVVPIYDAGIGPDGRPYYAMRLVRGRSLAERLADAPDLAARLALVRAFLAVCQAMAYAHRQGVIHRDLKPANVMIGEFGEVHVVDWGLARRLDEPEPEHEALAGTPAYLAPERARGDGSTPASDVWSLGAILGELLCGAALLPASRLEILARLSASEPPRWSWPPRCPGELVAIAHKALAWRVEDRYADAARLAADVSAYLDGRRVGAHAYSTTELARRLIYAWRWQVAAVTAGVVAGSVVLALTWSRIAGEQRRAIAAERRATSALADTRVALAWALDRGAVAALLAGDVAEAETYAAQALTYGESIDARGVLAATRAAARPQAATRVDVPGCARVVPDGATTFVCHGADQLALWDVGATAPRWQVPSVATSVVALEGRAVVALERGVAVTVLDGKDGAIRARLPVAALVDTLDRDPGATRVVASNQREAILIVPERDRVIAIERPCAGRGTLDALAVGRAQVLVACNDGQLMRIGDDGVGTAIAALPLFGHDPAASATLADDERTLAIGGVHGELVLVDLVTGVVSAPRQVLPEPVRRVRLLGELVVVAGERGGVHVWSRTLEAELVRLPERAGGRFEVAGDALVSGGAGWWRWRLAAGADGAPLRGRRRAGRRGDLARRQPGRRGARRRSAVDVADRARAADRRGGARDRRGEARRVLPRRPAGRRRDRRAARGGAGRRRGGHDPLDRAGSARLAPRRVPRRRHPRALALRRSADPLVADRRAPRAARRAVGRSRRAGRRRAAVAVVARRRGVAGRRRDRDAALRGAGRAGDRGARRPRRGGGRHRQRGHDPRSGRPHPPDPGGRGRWRLRRRGVARRALRRGGHRRRHDRGVVGGRRPAGRAPAGPPGPGVVGRVRRRRAVVDRLGRRRAALGSRRADRARDDAGGRRRRGLGAAAGRARGAVTARVPATALGHGQMR